MIRTLCGVLAPAGPRSRLSVMIFHRVLAQPDPLRPGEPTTDEFEQRMQWIKALFNVLPLPEAIERLRSGTLPARPLSITFDDGYADNGSLAAPILHKLGLPATFFVATRYLDGGCMFNDAVIESVRQANGNHLDLSPVGLGLHPVATAADRLATIGRILGRVKAMEIPVRDAIVTRIAELAGARLPSDLMMTRDAVAELDRQGMDIGAHTDSHPILASCDDAIASAEIRRGREQLETIVGHPVTTFAYPNGRPGRDYLRRHVDMARALGFSGAVSTAWGVSRKDSDPYQLPRFTPWDRSAWRYGLRMLGNLRHTEYERV